MVTEYLLWGRLLYAELIFSHVILTLSLLHKQALQAVSGNSRGTKDGVRGTPRTEQDTGPAGKHSILQKFPFTNTVGQSPGSTDTQRPFTQASLGRWYRW